MFRARRVLFVQFSGILRSSVEQTYRRLNQREHVLKRPDMYVGTVHPISDSWWLFDDATNKMAYTNVQYVPAFYKIFDEIIVNASDNKVREEEKQTYVKINVNTSTGWISVENDGNGIPVERHKEYKSWVPELIFGQLLTSSNYDDTQKRVTGGCYGYGAKLTNIFSKSFVVETYDARINREFRMEWSDNMSAHSKALITKHQAKNTSGYTKISFLPDYEILNMPDGITLDMQRMLYRRVLDLAGIMGATVDVCFNGKPINIHNFKDYAELYPIQTTKIVHRSENRWEIAGAICMDEKFHGISFVNSTFTSNNGTHVKYILDGLIKEIRSAVALQEPDLRIRPDYIKHNLFLFVNSRIENPQFDSQQKHELRSRQSSFGSHPDVKGFAEALIRETNILEVVIQEHYRRTRKRFQLATTNRGMLCIPKLEDATKAGTDESQKCTLLITEGDSAKALAVSGLNVIGREYYGIFPVRGKPMNVRGLSIQQIMRCNEVMNILAILGIDIEASELDRQQKMRYGRVMIMADQDNDGFHIKGLLCNLFEVVAPSLFRQSGFLSQFITPLIKVFGPRKFQKSFYSAKQYDKYIETLSPEEAKKLRTKYYKGLGTSTAVEAQDYFENLERNTIDFVYDPKTDSKALLVPFCKTKAEERKAWITKHARHLTQDFDFAVRQLSFHEFVDKQLIQFSLSDCARSIPNVIDGLKTTQRKIICGAFRRDLHESIKVQQLAGYVSEHCAYYHGDASLNGSIIRMAQDYVGSNNIALLEPEGQFGTRMQNGNDCAAPRYIFTKLNPIARFIFRAEDEPNLQYVHTDGVRTEPRFYVPIVPMALVNGSRGIATGFSTYIPPHNIREIIQCIREKLAGKKVLPTLTPYYEGFQGKVIPSSTGHITVGDWELLNARCIRIKEIPVSTSIHDIKERLNELYEKGIVGHYYEHHSSRTVDFDVYCHPQLISAMIRTNCVYRVFGLVSPKAYNQLVCLHGTEIKQFRDVKEIFNTHFAVRMQYYALRKESMLVRHRKYLSIQQNKHRFLRELLDGKLKLPNDPNDAPKVLRSLGFCPHPDEKSYAYLLDMRVSALNRTNLASVQNKINAVQKTIHALEKTTEKDLWLEDLRALETELARCMPAAAVHPKRSLRDLNVPVSPGCLGDLRKIIIANTAKMHATSKLIES